MFFSNNNNNNIVEPLSWRKMSKAVKKAAATALQNENTLIANAIKLGQNEIKCETICSKLPDKLKDRCNKSCEVVKTKVSGCVKDSISEISK